MSYYANVDDKDGGQVATNAGWHDFTAWVSMLDGVDELRQLTEYGLADDLELLVADLRGALEDGGPSDDQRSIGEGLLAIADGATGGAIITVTDGAGAEGAEGEE